MKRRSLIVRYVWHELYPRSITRSGDDGGVMSAKNAFDPAALRPRGVLGAGRNSQSRLSRTLLLATACLVMTGCSSSATPTQESSTPSRQTGVTPSRTDGEIVLDLSFDDAEPGDLEEGDTVALEVPEDEVATVVAPDIKDVPSLTVVDNDGGRSLRFPDPCDLGAKCRRQVLEIPDFDAANPGTASFSLGARVSIRRQDIRDGSNILQKGFSTDGEGQWKLQVDRQDGLPSCVLVPSGAQSGYVAKSDLDVADGQWHVIECGRSDGQWWIDVDGSRTSMDLPAAVVVSNDSPIRVGGKNVAENADPFFGLIDEVWFKLLRV